MKKKILFVNDEMVTGGVARILNTLLKNLDYNQYEVDLLVLHHHGDMLKEIPSCVNVIQGSPFFSTIDRPIKDLIKQKDIKALFSKTRLITYMKSGVIFKRIAKERAKTLTKNYDVEFSAKEGFCTIFVASGNSKRKLNWIQVDYEVQNYAKNHIPLLKEALHKIDLNIACSKKVKSAFENVFDVHNIMVVHNLMDIERIKQLASEKVVYPFSEGTKFIAVARFHPQKGLDRLLYSVRYLLNEGIECNLTLIGGGELDHDLKELAKSLNLEKNVCFLGFKANPYNYIKAADLFVMSSIYEGYPTIVIESLLSQTPVLSTKVAGVDEQIINYEDGVIVDNSQQALNIGLKNIITNGNLNSMKEKLVNYRAENAEILEMLGKCFNEK